jgi:hypothetical protein
MRTAAEKTKAKQSFILAINFIGQNPGSKVAVITADVQQTLMDFSAFVSSNGVKKAIKEKKANYILFYNKGVIKFINHDKNLDGFQARTYISEELKETEYEVENNK